MLKKMLNFIPGVAIPMMINFILTILYARYLTPGEYGILNIYLNTIQIVYALTLSVFQTSSLRFYSIEDMYEDRGEFYSSYIFGNVFITFFLIPIALLVNCFLKFNWWIVLLSIGCNGLFQFLCNCYRLENQSRRYNAARCVVAIASVITLVLGAAVVKPLTYIWPILAVYGCYGVFTFVELVRVRGDIRASKVNINLLKQSLIYGIPLIGVSVLGSIVASCDQYFLLYFLGDEAVGNYALGYRLVDSLVVNMLMMILLVMTPELNKQHDEYGEKSSSQTLKKMMSLASWIILPFSVAIIIYSDYIISYLFPTYTHAARIMQLVVFSSIFHGISMFTCKGLELVKHPKYIFYSLLIAGIINLFYNVIFIPIYGVNASAHSSLVAYVLYNALLILYTKRFYQISFDINYILKTIFATIITAILALVMMKYFEITGMLSFIMQIMISVMIYLGFSLVLKLHNILK